MFLENTSIKKRFKPAAAFKKKVTAVLSKYCKQIGIFSILTEDTLPCICEPDQCYSRIHVLLLSEKMWTILGFEDKQRKDPSGRDFVLIKDFETVKGERPAILAKS